MAARDVYLLLETSEQVSTLGRHRVKGNQMNSKLRCQKMRRAICHRRRKLLARRSCGSMKGRKKKKIFDAICAVEDEGNKGYSDEITRMNTEAEEYWVERINDEGDEEIEVEKEIDL